MTRDQLLETIQRAAREKKAGFGLSEARLTKLPPEIGQLSQLQELNLRGNQLIELPPEDWATLRCLAFQRDFAFYHSVARQDLAENVLAHRRNFGT